MYLEDIASFIINQIAPEEFRRDYEIHGFHFGGYNKKKIIKRIMLTVDLSFNALHFAIKNKINLIISLNGLINGPIKNFNSTLINKISILLKYPITIFVLSSSFYVAEGGIFDTILEALYLKLDYPFEIKNQQDIDIPVGRICIPHQYPGSNEIFTLEKLIHRIETNLKIKPILYLGELKEKVSRICIISGEDMFIKIFDDLIAQRCDCFITEKINKSITNYALELGVKIIEFSFYNCEILAIEKLCNFLSLKFPHDEFYLFNSTTPLKLY